MKTLLRPAHTDTSRLSSFARYASDRITNLEGEVVLWQRSHEALLRRQAGANSQRRLLWVIIIVLASLLVTSIGLLFHLCLLYTSDAADD